MLGGLLVEHSEVISGTGMACTKPIRGTVSVLEGVAMVLSQSQL